MPLEGTLRDVPTAPELCLHLRLGVVTWTQPWGRIWLDQVGIESGWQADAIAAGKIALWSLSDRRSMQVARGEPGLAICSGLVP